MTKSIARTLIDKPPIDYEYMAKLFVTEYNKEPKRGYGSAVQTLFTKLKNNQFKEIFKPAESQFEGQGSLGNGGGMRIAPIGLFFQHNYDAMVEAAITSSKLTHTHLLGVNGALLQCIAVNQALLTNSKEKIVPKEFTNKLIERIKPFETILNGEQSGEYEEKLKVVTKILETSYKHQDLQDFEAVKYLGNGIEANNSIPTAIYCFLRALQEIDGVKVKYSIKN